MADRSLTRHAELGRYERLEPGVYRVVGAPSSTLQRIAAAVASFPALAAASHQTAAELWGLTTRGIRTIDVVTSRWDRVHRSHLRVHESLDLQPEDIVERLGVSVTIPARTVVDLGATNRWLVESALDEGIRVGLFTLEDVQAFVDRVARRGRRGVGVIRPLLSDRWRWQTSTESALEDAFRNVLVEGGLPLPEAQFVVHDQAGALVCRADFAYPSARVLIELDGAAFHTDRVAFRRDRLKQNRATLLGWTVLRYTWWDVEEQAGRIWSEIRSVLQRSATP